MIVSLLRRQPYRRLAAGLLLVIWMAQSCSGLAPLRPAATQGGQTPAAPAQPAISTGAAPSLEAGGALPVATAPSTAAAAGASQSGPVFRNVSLNSPAIPRAERLEITFDLDTAAVAPQFPYDPVPPPGVTPGMGVSVEAQFTPDGWRSVYRQPAFLYQEFVDETHARREWIYPSGAQHWKVRFSPPTAGDWQVKLSARDAGGSSETAPLAFRVTPSDRPGFIRVSKQDARYFEYENGEYFPALGYNLNYDAISWTNPILDNEENFRIMGQNGIQLARMWLSQWSIYGSAWNPWNSILPEQHSRYIPFSGLSLKDPFPGEAGAIASDASMKLDAGANPCMFLGFMKPAPAVKPNTRYRVRVRYRSEGLSAPRAAGAFGLVVKTGGWLWGSGQNCNDPGVGQAATAAPGGESPGWRILEGQLTTGAGYFMPNFYLALENVTAGAAFIDYVWVEEDLGGGRYGPNILPKPWMSHDLYFDQRNSFAFDKVLELAEKYGVYLRPVLLEKNDFLFNRIDFNGQPIVYDARCDDNIPGNDPAKCPGNQWFYGNGRQMTKTRWLQTAWWRYAQARWGYSPNIHSWELLNEGDPASTAHYILADELGKYMRQFAPNQHMVSTSFWHSFPRDRFWANPAYPNVDFADIHRYVEDTSSVFRDTTEMTLNLSLQLGAKQPGGAGKPVIRGETGLQGSGGDSPNPLIEQDKSGVWLHNYIWGGINPGGLIEEYWWVKEHIYRYAANGALLFDHRPQYGSYYRFIRGIRLNRGGYQDAAAKVSNSRLRALGQKDAAHGLAHLWVQNTGHTWYNVVSHASVSAASGTLRLDGFQPGERLRLEWWDPYSTSAERDVIRSEYIQADADGVVQIAIQNLSDDLALRLWPAAPQNTYQIYGPPVKFQ